jgi:hypothetical protein
MTTEPPLPHCNPVADMILNENKLWVNKLTDSQPSVLHFNGGGKSHHLDMERKVWYKSEQYNNTPELKRELNARII